MNTPLSLLKKKETPPPRKKKTQKYLVPSPLHGKKKKNIIYSFTKLAYYIVSLLK